MDHEHAAALLLEHAMQDWRDVLPRITVPTLVFGGEASMFPPAGAHLVATAIPGSTLRVLSAAERGSHLPHLENPAAVNSAIRSFMEVQTEAHDRPVA
jgi:non-heme chloroperoxidase